MRVYAQTLFWLVRVKPSDQQLGTQSAQASLPEPSPHPKPCIPSTPSESAARTKADPALKTAPGSRPANQARAGLGGEEPAEGGGAVLRTLAGRARAAGPSMGPRAWSHFCSDSIPSCIRRCLNAECLSLFVTRALLHVTCTVAPCLLCNCGFVALCIHTISYISARLAQACGGATQRVASLH